MTDTPTPPFTRLGPFRVLSQLGQGGMGQTFLVEQRRPLPGGGEYVRKLAVKRMADELQSDAQAVERFVDEVRQQALIHCDHVVSSFDADFDAEGRPFHVMEWIDGCDLSDLLRRYYDHSAFYQDVEPDQLEHLDPEEDECLSLPAATHIVLGIADAIATMHAEARGVVHRDLKPGNVLISLHGRVCVTDFGLTYSRDRGFDTTFAGRPNILGSKPYMAPEQWLCQAPPDHSWDLYSLGIIFYELLTGQLPFPVADGQLVISEDPAVRDGAMARFEAIRPDVPHRVCDLVRSLIARRHTDRPEHVSDVLAALVDVPVTRGDLLPIRHHVRDIAIGKRREAMGSVEQEWSQPPTVPFTQPRPASSDHPPVSAATSTTQASGGRGRAARRAAVVALAASAAAALVVVALRDQAPLPAQGAQAAETAPSGAPRPDSPKPTTTTTAARPTTPQGQDRDSANVAASGREAREAEGDATAERKARRARGATAPAENTRGSERSGANAADMDDEIGAARRPATPGPPRAVTIRSLDCIASPVQWAHVYYKGRYLGWTPTQKAVQLPLGTVTLGLSKVKGGATTPTRVQVHAADAHKDKLLVDCDKL